VVAIVDVLAGGSRVVVAFVVGEDRGVASSSVEPQEVPSSPATATVAARPSHPQERG